MILSERVKGLVIDPAIDNSYFLASGLVLGRSYWVDSAKKFAIFWTSLKNWHLAPYSKVGTEYGSILYAQGKDLLTAIAVLQITFFFLFFYYSGTIPKFLNL